jgi:uncharacterized protein (DUF362 family)/Pyruvate/2-oxoacid:ferredoxin oxidoreductase delta subunit
MEFIMPQVLVLKCDSYDTEVLDKNIEHIFIDLGIDSLLNTDMKILIKPNFLMRKPVGRAVTTNPEIIKSVVRALKNRNINNITIADSPGGPYYKEILKGIYTELDLINFAKENNIVLNYDTSYKSMQIKGKVCRSLDIITPVLESDFIIDLAKLKTHGMTGMSGAVKNLFGCVPGLLKPELHMRYPDKEIFGEMLVDLCEFVKPDLSIIDGIIAMEGDGPTSGTPRALNTLIASRSPYNADLIACEIIGMKPEEICMVNAAIKRELCPSSFKSVIIIGEDLINIMVKDFKKPATHKLNFSSKIPILNKYLTDILSPKPKINKKKCIGCGKCAESCPQKIIDIKNKKAFININNCIKCFCCHEMCPYDAIKIKRIKIFKL